MITDLKVVTEKKCPKCESEDVKITIGQAGHFDNQGRLDPSTFMAFCNNCNKEFLFQKS